MVSLKNVKLRINIVFSINIRVITFNEFNYDDKLTGPIRILFV